MEDSLNNSIVSEEQQSATQSPGFRETAAYYLTQPVVRLLAKTPIAPDAITWFGFLLTIGAAVLIISGNYCLVTS